MNRENNSKAIDSLELAHMLAGCAVEKKARQISLLDVSALTDYAGFVLIMTAGNERHARALADHLQRQLRAAARPLGVEGYQQGQWILLDYGDVIVHILQQDARYYYDLDGLWHEAKKIEVGKD